jgi:hypothetical protein
MGLSSFDVQRAFQVILDHDFIKYTGDSFYPELAYTDALAMTQSSSAASAARTHLYSLPVSDRLNEWVRMNNTDWQVPDNSNEYWAYRAGNITTDCSVREKILQSNDMALEFLLLMEQYFSFDSMNDFWAEKAYYAIYYNSYNYNTYEYDAQASQALYDRIMAQPLGDRGQEFVNIINEGDVNVWCTTADYRFSNYTDINGDWWT